MPSGRATTRSAWTPAPGCRRCLRQTIGLYHAFVRGHNHDTRVHKLFIVVSGGCSQASDEFYNSILDCHGKVSAYDCATAEESWWLRRACYSARCRLLADCASHFGRQIFKIQDTKSCSDSKEVCFASFFVSCCLLCSHNSGGSYHLNS